MFNWHEGVMATRGRGLSKITRAALVFVMLTPSARHSFGGELFRDDFSRFPPGVLSAPLGTLNGAVQEYHYIAHRGVPTSPWRNPIVHEDTWAAGDEQGVPYLEQHTIAADRRHVPLFVTGDAEWSDYTVEAKVRPLSRGGEDMAGLVFRYHTSRHFYMFVLTGGNRARLAVRQPLERQFRQSVWRELAGAPFAYETTRYYALRVENDGPRIRAYVDGRLVLEASDGELQKGSVGVTADRPARFQDFRVSVSDQTGGAIRARLAAREAKLARLRADNPRPLLWKKFETPGFGVGRNVRFGDLDGDRRPDMLLAQNTPKVRGDAYDQISCLTAVNLDGKILWQQGRPNPKNGLLTNDTPFQIYDLDADGRNEVILVRDFQLQVLDGRTGKLLRQTWMPKAMPDNNNSLPYELTNGDSILLLNATGDAAARGILIKDRYRGFWVFGPDLKLKWEGRGETGHYPFPFDLDGDGRQEFMLGYSMWDSGGRRLWTLEEELEDHADAISIGNFSGDPGGPVRTYVCASDEGFVVIGADGKIVKHVRIGHAQTQSVGKFRPEAKGLQIFTVNFWRNPGIVTLFDHDGNILAQEEMVPGSSHVMPVNWRGDGQEFALLSGNVAEGGMIDGRLWRVVMFPDDGHPDLAYHVADVTGDARDEIILWDERRVWVYTQDRPAPGTSVYRPRRNPDYNDSNYRATVSLPPASSAR